MSAASHRDAAPYSKQVYSNWKPVFPSSKIVGIFVCHIINWEKTLHKVI